MPPPAGFFVDHALSARLEAAHASQLHAIARAVREHAPSSSATSIDVGGGVASFILPHLSLSRAVGLGMRGPVSAEAMDTLEEFFQSRGTGSRIRLSPFAHRSLFEQLAGRRFHLVYLDTVLLRLLAPDEPFDLPGGPLTVRRAELHEAASWVSISTRGFEPEAKADPVRLRSLEAACFTRGASYLFAFVDGAPAGAGAIDVDGKTARLFAASTVPEHRGRGVQGALVAARLSLARDLGCTHVTVETEPGGPSQRNMERFGFFPVYSQAMMLKEIR